MMSRAALRACARVAWRQARRAPGRSALVIAMIALPVTALTAGATLIRTSVPTVEEHATAAMGSAELELHPPFNIDDSALERDLPAGSRVVSISQWNHTMVLDGSLVFVSVSEPSIPIDRPPIPGLYQLMEGRAPAKPGEVAVDPRVLEIFGVEIGDALTIAERSFQVVGVAVRPSYTFDALLVAAPGTLGPPAEEIGERGEVCCSSYLVDLPGKADVDAAAATVQRFLVREAERSDDPAAREQVRAMEEEHGTVVTREWQARNLYYENAGTITGVSFAGTAGALFATGLISAAAFAVGIRRQLRMLGLVGATGGEPAHVRAVVLFGGTTLGMAGAAIGMTIGIAAAYAFTPHLHRFTHALPGPVALHIPTILGAGLLGVVAATAAAAWPARLAVRISTLDALAARMPAPRPPGRLARYGLVVVAVGALLTGVVFTPGENEVVFTAGLILMVGGFLVSVPWLVTVAGRFAPRLPTASRLAVRDTARHGRRTGTAIAAAALALTTPVAITALSVSEESYQRRNLYIGENHILIGDLLQDIQGRGQAAAPDLLQRIPAVLPGAIVVTPRTAVLDFDRYPPLPGEKPPQEYGVTAYTAWVEGPIISAPEGGGVPGPIAGDDGYRRSGQIYIGGPELLRALDAEDGISALEAGKVVGIGPESIDEDVVHLLMFSMEGEPPRVDLPAVEAGDITYSSDLVPPYVVSPEGAAKLGLLPGAPSFYGTFVAAPGPLTNDQIDAVKELAAAYPSAYIQTLDDFMPDFDAARLAATGGAVVIALAIVAVVVALVGAEARRDQAILVAVGGGPRARRRISAARAGLVALLAAAIAVPAGFAPVAVVQWSRPENFPVVTPWTTIALVLLAVPLVAAGFGWLTSRAPKGTAMLNPVA